MPPEHSTIEAFACDSGSLVVGGVPIERLAHRVGSTPFFAYDRGLLTQRIEQLRSALPGAIELGYAIKANPMPAVVQHISRMVDSLDVASALEMRTALDTEIAAENVSFAGPGKTEAELRQAVAAGIIIEMESRTEILRITRIGESLGIRPRAAIRVNPDFQIKGSGMLMGGGAQQFGIDAEIVPAVLKEMSEYDIDMIGFHIFAGSQNLRADLLCEAHRKTAELALKLTEDVIEPVRYINLGGGLGIPYTEKEQPLDLEVIGDNLKEIVSNSLRPRLPDSRLVLELGRYIVGECGVYVTRVIDRKESRGETFLVVDGGLHHQLAASGNLGQVIRRNFPLAIGNRMGEEPTETVHVVGCLCTPLDLLGHKVNVPKSEIGDLIVIFQAGAYGLTASPSAFLSHSEPPEILV